MPTKSEIEKAFRADFQAVLDKYGAEIEASDHYCGYAECGEDIRMIATISTFGVYVEIDLGSWLRPTKKPNPEA